MTDHPYCRLCGEDVTPGAPGSVTDPEAHRCESLTFHVECIRTQSKDLATLRRLHPRLAGLLDIDADRDEFSRRMLGI